MLHAIVYTSNASNTARYAQLLGQATGLPVFSAQEAHKNLASGDILYLGWVMAGTVKGYQQAAKLSHPRRLRGGTEPDGDPGGAGPGKDPPPQ